MKLASMRTALEEISNPGVAGVDETLEFPVVGAIQQLESHLDGHHAVDAAGEKLLELEIATESFGGGFREGASEIIGDLRGELLDVSQYFVLVFKQQKDFFSDLFRSTQDQITKYEEIIGEAKQEYVTKKGAWENNLHGGSSSVLWQHFATDQGIPARELPEIMKRDLEMSKYVLTEYPTKVLEQFKKLTSAVRSGNLSTIAKAVALIKNIEKLEHPVEAFQSKYLGHGRPYFDVTGLEEKSVKPRPVITLDGDGYTKLAALAAASKVVEDWSGWHATKKLASKAALLPVPAFNAHRVVAGYLVDNSEKSYELTTAEIGEIISNGQRYLDNVTSFLKLESRFISAIDEFDSAIKRLVQTTDEHMSGDEQTKIKQVLKQIEQCGSAFVGCLQSPSGKEVARSLKTARYCGYLGKRMVLNAN